jgi:DNA-directed RNA polymerase specialized sigma24 family protein
MGDAPLDNLRAAQAAAIARANWASVVPRLHRFARSRGATEANAKDAAQTAVTQLLEGKTSWNPAAEPDVLLYLMRAVRTLLKDARQSAQSRYEQPSVDIDRQPAPPPSEPVVAREARVSDALGRLRHALRDDAEALAVLDLTVEDVHKPAEQAARLGIPVGKVYDARDRIGRQVRRIGHEMADEASKEREEVAE